MKATRAGRSGQVSVDERQKLIGEGDLKTQALRAFRNLEVALSAAGAKTTDVVKLNIYVEDYKPEDAAAVGEALRKHFPRRTCRRARGSACSR